MIDVVIVGGGAVACALASEVEAAQGLRLVQRWTRKSHLPSELAPADLYILAVSDSAIGEVSAELPFASGSVVAHTAGSMLMETLSSRIADRAVLYPLQTFTCGRRIENFRRVPIFIEGDTPRALEIVDTVARVLSDNVVEMSSARRAKLHLAATFACNFSNAMLSQGEEIAAEAGVPFDYLKPLIAETVAKALTMPSPRCAQTGPAQRGDKGIQDKHIEMLRQAGHPELAELYRDISEQIWRISKKN